MAINDSSNNAMAAALNKAKEAQTQAQPQPQVQPNYGQSQSEKDKFDWANLNAEMPYHVSISPNSLSISQFEKAMKEFWDENITRDLDVAMIPVDRTNIANLAVSVLLVIARDSSKETARVAYHALLIENSVEPFPPRIENIGGKPIEVMQLTSDTYDASMINILHEVVKSMYPKAEHILNADAEVIPRHFDLTNENNIRYITINSLLACRSVLATHDPNFKDLNLINARKNTSNLSQTVVFSKQVEEHNQAGFPVRNDIVMTTVATPVQNSNNFITQNQTVITRTTGYIDLLYQDTGNFFSHNGNAMWAINPINPAAPTPVYQANFVLTSLNNFKMQTLPGILLALVNASFIREDNRWLPALMPVPGVKDDMHSIGNIGYDIPVFGDGKIEPFAVTADKFDYSDLARLYARFFHQGLAISLDVPECGPESWQYKVFAAAALNNQNAINAIRNAADILTNGYFTRYYAQMQGGSNQFVFTNENMIFNGYYIDKNNRRRDIRDLDYLAVAGMAGKKNRDEIATYTDTFNAALPLADRMHTRRVMTTSYLPNVVFTGRSVRVSFEAQFIIALIQGAMECGYHVTPQQQHMDNINYQRANAGYINGAVLAANTSGIFRNVGPGPQYSGYNGRYVNYI